MKTSIRIALCLFVLAGLTAYNAAQEKATSEFTVVVPERGQEETVVKIYAGKSKDGKKYDGEGGTRTIKMSLEKGKEYTFKVEALIEPNNYTKITRYKEVTIKGGDNVKVDLTVKNPKTDKIVVRWVPTPDDIVDEMCKMAKVGKNDTVYDLGCGDAVMLIRPIQKFGAKKGVGIDIDPKMIDKAKDNVKKANLEKKIELRVGDILNVKDMKDADVVLLYIGDDLGERLSPVLQKTMKPGARIVSHRFSLGEWEPNKKVTVKGEDGGEYDLLLWVVPEKKAEKKKDAN
jgi:uncharacterized protein (TIGR03000 family)